MNFNYDEWNKIKKRISLSDHTPPYYKNADIWWISVGYNIGCEIYGKGPNYVRPILILRKFNQYTFVGVPLSTKLKDNPYYIPIRFNNKTVSALTSQIRTFSSKRMENKQGELNLKEYKTVIDEILKLFRLPPSITRGSRG